jgi:hypothetical protein
MPGLWTPVEQYHRTTRPDLDDVLKDRLNSLKADRERSDERLKGPLVVGIPAVGRVGDATILDNLGSHKGKPARNAIRARGAHLLFLPPCSPDLNPIELATRQTKDVCR